MIPNVEKSAKIPKLGLEIKKLYFTKIKFLALFLPFKR